MTTAREELDEFYRYASMRIASGESAIDLDDLLQSWHDERDRQQTHGVIVQGLADIERGLGVPAREFSETLRVRYGSPST